MFESYTEAGALYLQYAAGIERLREGGSEQAHALALGWSPTAAWYTAVYAGWYREPDEAFGLYAASWTNHLNLAQQGAFPFGLGFYLDLERPRDRSEGYGITVGPTLQLDTAHVQLNLNVWLQKDVQADTSEPAALIYQWQAKTLLRPGFELGAQGFGNVGAWRHWARADEQEHLLGPAVFWKGSVGDGQHVRLDAAALAGLTTASPRTTLRLRAQLQF